MSEFTLEPLEDYPQRERVLALAAEHADAVGCDNRVLAVGSSFYDCVL